MEEPKLWCSSCPLLCKVPLALRISSPNGGEPIKQETMIGICFPHVFSTILTFHLQVFPSRLEKARLDMLTVRVL
jgi:hypothetical protein